MGNAALCLEIYFNSVEAFEVGVIFHVGLKLCHILLKQFFSKLSLKNCRENEESALLDVQAVLEAGSLFCNIWLPLFLTEIYGYTGDPAI